MSDSEKKIFDTVGNVLASLLNVMQVIEQVAFLKRLLDSPEFKKNFEVSRRGLEESCKKSDQNQRAKRARYIKGRVARDLYLCFKVIGIFKRKSYNHRKRV